MPRSLLRPTLSEESGVAAPGRSARLGFTQRTEGRAVQIIVSTEGVTVVSNYKVVLMRGVDEKLGAVTEPSYGQVVAALDALGADPVPADKQGPIQHGSVDAGAYRIGYMVDAQARTVLVGNIFPIPPE